MKKPYLILVISLILSSCYEESELPGVNWDVFDMTISQNSLDSLFLKYDTGYVIADPLLELNLNSQPVFMKRLRVRGRTSLDYRRKSFSVKLDYPIYVQYTHGGELKRLPGFKLISLSMDYTYINNRLAYGILQQVGVNPLFCKYVELHINGGTGVRVHFPPGLQSCDA